MCIPCWVLLGLEQSIKVPEWALNEVIGWHLGKSKTSEAVEQLMKCNEVSDFRDGKVHKHEEKENL